MPTDTPKTFLTVGQVAALFEVSPRTIRDWAENGHLPSLRVGSRGHRRFRREDVEKVLADLPVGAAVSKSDGSAA